MTDTNRIHVAYLDGIRGWAALFVAIHHAWQLTIGGPPSGAPPRWFSAMTVFKYGTYAVATFIVLSGYCLMIPVARSATTELAGGARRFFTRRARRILIPYGAALTLSLIFIALYPRLQVPTGTQWDHALPALTSAPVIAHLLLVHNWFADLQWTINPPMWSVAAEWQIYFLFALILLPAWRRLGPFAALALAFVLGLLPMFAGYAFVFPWYVGLFALGMVAAAINFTPGMAYGPSEPRVWERGSILLWCAVGLLTLAKVEALQPPHPLVDVLVGLAVASFLIAATRRLQRDLRATWVARFFEHPVSANLGRFSYSIYLMHLPIMAALNLQLVDQKLSPAPQFGLLVFVALPLALLVSYGFHRVFERPFMAEAAGARLSASKGELPVSRATST